MRSEEVGGKRIGDGDGRREREKRGRGEKGRGGDVGDGSIGCSRLFV